MNILKNQFTHKFIMRLKSKGNHINAAMPESSFDTPLQEVTNDKTITSVANDDLSTLANDIKKANNEIAATSEPREVIETVETVKKGRTYNTMLDKTIDLQLYMRRAKKSNYKATKNAGTEIKANNLDVYKDLLIVYKNALNEKYENLVVDAKTHDNPENYIYQKYFNVNSDYYELNLTEAERRIAYQYEIQMYTTGKLSHFKAHDSLFREIIIDQNEIDKAKNVFNMKMVNTQISNILKMNDIELPPKTSCTFTVDPYSYYISVTIDSVELKDQIEKALNVGENGKNLWRHIKNNALQENALLVTEKSYLKYQTYHQVLEYTGLKLDELIEKKEAYYTDWGEDIFDMICRSINESMTIPPKFKRQHKDWINNSLTDLAKIGWCKIPDLVLKMEYNK